MRAMASPATSVRFDLVVQDLTQLQNVLVSNVVTGANAWVIADNNYWIFKRNCTDSLSPDVIQPNYGPANSRWVRMSSAASGPAGGDLEGEFPNPAVSGIKGIPIESGLPENGDGLVYNSATNTWDFVPVTGGGGGEPSGPASGDLGGLFPSPVVVALRGSAISPLPPSIGDTLTWNGTSWTPQAPSTHKIEWQANCSSTLSVGDLVISEEHEAGILSVTKIDIALASKMPAIGIVSSKDSDTSCIVVSAGLVSASGLIPGATYFASTSGTVTSTVPVPTTSPLFLQTIGVAVSSDLLLVQLPSSIVERVA